MKNAIILIFLFLILFPFRVSAEESTYKEQYESSGAGDLKYALDDDSRAFFEENDIDASDYGFVNDISVSSVFSHIATFLKSGMKSPLKAGISVLCIILIAAAFTAFNLENEKFAPAVYAATLAVTLIIVTDIWNCILTGVNAAKGCSSFMLAFIPIFIGIMAVSGRTVTAAASNTVLLAATNFLSSAMSFFVLPILGAYLSLSVSTSVSPLLERSGTVGLIKKISVWAMSLISTIFIGILSIQTAVNSAADTLTLKTTKFIVGTSVPVAGAALSEATSTIFASISLLKSSVGIYGIIAIFVILIPIVIELIMWRLILLLDAAIADIFSLSKISGLLRAVDTMLSILLGILLFIGALFIISLTILVTAGKVS